MQEIGAAARLKLASKLLDDMHKKTRTPEQRAFHQNVLQSIGTPPNLASFVDSSEALWWLGPRLSRSQDAVNLFVNWRRMQRREGKSKVGTRAQRRTKRRQKR